MKQPARLLTMLTAMVVVWAAGAVSVSSQTPATSGSGPGKDLRAQAIGSVLDGKIAEGLAMLKDQSLRDDQLAAKARNLLDDYLKVRAGADQERQTGRESAEARVRLAGLAEAQRPALAESKLVDDLYKRVEAVADALLAADRLLSLSSASQPAEIIPQVKQHLEKAQTELAALKATGDGQGDWGTAFKTCAASVSQAAQAYLAAWEKASLPGDWRTLKRAFEKVQDSMIDLGVLVSRDPLLVALSNAREARELTGDAAKFLQQAWVKDLIARAEKRGQQDLAEAKWSHALSIYGHGGLSDLDEGSAAYKDMVRKVGQHVRVLNLYGRNGGASQPGKATSNPASEPSKGVLPGDPAPDGEDGPVPVADEPRWREMIAGIDAVMVRNAISQIDDNYVERPDYRKISSGALNAVKVLAETKQAENSFPVLADEAKRKTFIAAVDAQLAKLKSKDTVDHLDLALALDRVLDVNGETLNLPSEVVDMEFAEGMLGQLDDFSGMIWPYEEEDFNKRTMGSFFGIGVQIRKEPGKPIEVVTPLPDSPAFRAGILAGDLILEVDARRTESLTVDRAVKMITGPRLTKVKLTIQRPGQPKPEIKEVERDEIHIQTVKGWRAEPGGKWDYFIDPAARIAYVRVTQFTGDTSDEIHQALKAVREGGAEGAILDLRFNPGGLLTGAVDMADEFLRRGLIVRTEGRNAPEAPKDATALGQYQDGKLVVLVNQYSASAAEIVAGALKDWRRAEIVGDRSYGKGSVQRLIPLKNKKAKLKLTTAYYYLPSGRCLHRTNGAKDWGVDPDVSAPITVRQMNRWTEIRQETDLLKKIEPERLSSLLDQQLTEDMQLQTAIMLLKLEQLNLPAESASVK